MRPFTSTIPLEDAQRLLASAIVPISRTERVPLAQASGRVASDDVHSPLDVPPFARSAMDGYAVIAADTTGASTDHPSDLHVIDRIYAGRASKVMVTRGTCAEIATGAPLPSGADAVVMVEDTSRTAADIVRIGKTVATGQHVAPRGADIVNGEAVVRAGELLTPGRVGAIAAVGGVDVAVFAKPVVAIVSTGNELADAGSALAEASIFDVNRFTLGAVVAAHGGTPEFHHTADDTIESLERALERAGAADVIVFSGGSSVGERDLLIDVIARHGEVVFHGIAVKPGKPTAFARLGERALFAMPGNPASCLSNAYVLLVPFLRTTARLPAYAPHTVSAALTRRIASTVDRHQFFTVRVKEGLAYPAFKGSGDITSLSEADGYIEIAAGVASMEEGAVVEVKLF